MIRLVLGLFLLIGISAQANTERAATEAPVVQYRIEAKIFVEGKLMSAPMIMALDGEEASIIQSAVETADFMSLEVFPFTISDSTLYVSAKFERNEKGDFYNFGYNGEIEVGKEIEFSRLDNSNKPVRVVLKVDRM